jgi:hypothetical protein
MINWRRELHLPRCAGVPQRRQQRRRRRGVDLPWGWTGRLVRGYDALLRRLQALLFMQWRGPGAGVL